jgi:integrase/recombinase XerD
MMLIKLRTHMMDSIFLIESVRETHRRAPLFAERERYLRYLFEIGIGRKRVRSIATMLLHVMRLLKLDSSRPVGMNEILQGCERWVDDTEACRHRRSGEASSYTFQSVAINWLRFQGSLRAAPQAVPLFGNLLSEFLNAMRSQRGLALETLQSYRSRIQIFLNWLHSRCPEFAKVRALDIEEYLDTKRLNGCSCRSIAAHCIALRTFFEYAEQRRWCPSGIRGSISGPRVPRVAEDLSGPPWEHVRRVVSSIGNITPADLRAKAMVQLLSIYGLRSAEVRGLTLEDIDWRRASITVRRAKRGRTQQFPLQNEVGEAIALYLEKARPKCICRSLFVTLHPPYRPISGHAMSTIICPRTMKFGITARQSGPHMLRRACATQLLRTGCSLMEIADFLGHSDLRSVSNYVRFEPTSLTNVAKFSLRGVL